VEKRRIQIVVQYKQKIIFRANTSESITANIDGSRTASAAGKNA
jgi:hypothetical protein